MEIIFCIFIVIIFSVIIFLSAKWSNTIQAPIQIQEINGSYSTADFGSRCVTENTNNSSTINSPLNYLPGVCKSGLTCVKIYPNDEVGICRKPLGASCNNIYECTSEATVCLNGVCSTYTPGGMGQECLTVNGYLDCAAGFKCNGDICLKDNGETCTYSNECASNICSNFVCLDLIRPGEVCVSTNINYCGDDTGTWWCDGHFCQPASIFGDRNIKTGEPNAVCYISNPNSLDVPLCNNNLICNKPYYLGETINQFGNEFLGTCQIPQGEWLQACSSDHACKQPLICLDGICVNPTNINNCGFGTSFTCNDGFSCVDGICVGKSNAICNSGDYCETSLCGIPKILRWVHSTIGGNGSALGSWQEIGTIPIAPTTISEFTVYETDNKGIYYPGYGSVTFFIVNLLTDEFIPYRVTSSEGITLNRVKSVRFGIGGSILIHASFIGEITYERVFKFNNDVTSFVIDNLPDPYKDSGLVDQLTFSYYDYNDLTNDFAIITSTNILYGSGEINEFEQFSDSISTTDTDWVKFNSNGDLIRTSYTNGIVFSNSYTILNQDIKLDGIGIVFDSLHTDANSDIWYTIEGKIYYSNRVNQYQVPGYSSISGTSTTINKCFTMGSLSRNLYTINRTCS